MLAGSTSLCSPRGGTGLHSLACLCGVLEKEKVPAVPSVANAWFMQRCHGVTCPRAGSSNPKFTRATNQPEKIPGRGFSPAVGLLVPVAPELSAGAAAVGRRKATGHRLHVAAACVCRTDTPSILLLLLGLGAAVRAPS